jgi:hypothetical protein
MDRMDEHTKRPAPRHVIEALDASVEERIACVTLSPRRLKHVGWSPSTRTLGGPRLLSDET